jgi:biotin transport system substrate-specific component
MYTALIKNQTKSHPILSHAIKVFLGSLFVAASAQISIPFYPVPMTMQPAALMIVGLMCSPRMAASIVAVYLAEAFVGLPVLSNFSGGPAHLFGTRGGFIFGFLPLAFLTSYISHLSKTLLTQIIACSVGTIALYFFGVSWLTQFIGLDKALHFGLFPFLLEIPLFIGFAISSAWFLKNRASK